MMNELSGGQRQRVFIARALAQEATIVLLDEAFSGVDVGAQEGIVQVLQTLRDEGKIVLLATHDLTNLAERFDQVLCINRHVCAFGPAPWRSHPRCLRNSTAPTASTSPEPTAAAGDTNNVRLCHRAIPVQLHGAGADCLHSCRRNVPGYWRLRHHTRTRIHGRRSRPLGPARDGGGFPAGDQPFLAAVPAGIAIALLMGYLTRRTGISDDTSIGVVFCRYVCARPRYAFDRRRSSTSTSKTCSLGRFSGYHRRTFSSRLG